MKRNILNILPVATSILILGACGNKSEIPVNPHADGIVFSADAATMSRVTTGADFKAVFNDNDEIGIWAVKRTNAGTPQLPAASGNHADNIKYVRQPDGTWTSATPIQFPLDGSTLDFYACYPYQSTATADAIIMDVSSSALDHDMMTAAYTAGLTAGNREIPTLNFAHNMALVQVEVKTANSSNDFTQLAPAVKLLGIQPVATADLTVPALTTSGTAADVDMFSRNATTPNTQTTALFWAYVPEQTIADQTGFIQIAFSGDEYIYKLNASGGYLLATANVHKFSISIDQPIGGGSVSIVPAESVTDWLSASSENVGVVQ